jgi:CRP-like cAMP-binding protein
MHVVGIAVVSQESPLDPRARSPNHLLASLPAEDFEFIRPHLRSSELVHEHVLANAGETIPRVYFPHTGVISLVVNMSEGEMVEVAMIGRDGVFGASMVRDGATSLSDAMVQLPGVAFTLELAHFRNAVEKSVFFREALVRQEQAVLIQAQQSAACNAYHSVEARLSRWLLRIHDLFDSNTLPLTQGFLAQMIGVRRNSVSLVANTLQQAGLIRYSRGHIQIRRLEGLKEIACECYETVKLRCDALFAADLHRHLSAQNLRQPDLIVH